MENTVEYRRRVCLFLLLFRLLILSGLRSVHLVHRIQRDYVRAISHFEQTLQDGVDLQHHALGLVLRLHGQEQCRQAQHIARFMDMAQDCLAHIQPMPKGKEDHLESLYSLVQISERIAKGVMKQLEDGEMGPLHKCQEVYIMAENKPGVMLYFETLQAIEELEAEEAKQILNAIHHYCRDGDEPTFHGMSAALWHLIRNGLDRDGERYNEKQRRGHWLTYCRKCKSNGTDPLDFDEWAAQRAGNVPLTVP